MQAIDFDGFAKYLALHDRRKTTIRKHLICLKRWEQLLPELTIPAVEQLLLTLKETDSNSYLNNMIGCLRIYCQFKELDAKLQKYPFFPKRYLNTRGTLSDDEIEAFLALPRRSHQPSLHHLRMTMFWSICFFTGMRMGEVAKLTVSDIDWGRGVFLINESKTNTPRFVPIAPNIADKLHQYASDKDTYLFPSKMGGHHYSMDGHPVIDSVDWHLDWKKRLEAMELKRKGLVPYSCRHSYATRLLEEDVSLFHVKKLLGHHDLKSTLAYEHLTTKDMIKAQQKLPLIRKGSDPKAVLQYLSEFVKSFHIESDLRFNYRLEENEHSLKFEVYLK